MRPARATRGNRKPRHRTDRWERLAAEAQRPDRHQVIVRKLRCRVALDRERQILAAHSGTVVGDRDPPAPAAVGTNVDAHRARIERVFDELLDHARRTLDDLTGGDAVDSGGIELTDRHGATQADQDPNLVDAAPRGEVALPVTS